LAGCRNIHFDVTNSDKNYYDPDTCRRRTEQVTTTGYCYNVLLLLLLLLLLLVIMLKVGLLRCLYASRLNSTGNGYNYDILLQNPHVGYNILSETLALYKSFTYLLTYLHYKVLGLLLLLAVSFLQCLYLLMSNVTGLQNTTTTTTTSSLQHQPYMRQRRT